MYLVDGDRLRMVSPQSSDGLPRISSADGWVIASDSVDGDDRVVTEPSLTGSFWRSLDVVRGLAEHSSRCAPVVLSVGIRSVRVGLLFVVRCCCDCRDGAQTEL